MLDLCLCIFLAFVEQDKRELGELSRRYDIGSVVIRLLQKAQSRDFDILSKDGENALKGISKSEKMLVRD